MTAHEESPVRLEPSSCALCDAQEADLLYARCHDRLHGLAIPEVNVVRCSACGLVRTDPRPTAESLGACYPDDYELFSVDARTEGPSLPYRLLRWLVRVPYTIRFGRPDKHLELTRAGQSFLDAGCGAGEMLDHMSQQGWRVAGIEPDVVAAERAQKRIGAVGRVHVTTCEAADLDADSFDLVLMMHVLEHTIDPVEALRRCARWLKPGGRLVLRLPRFDSLESRLFGRFWFGLDLPRHLWHFTPATLTATLEAAGLRAVIVRPEYQASCLAGSISHVVNACFRRRPRRRVPRWLYHVAVGCSAVPLALGLTGTMEVVVEHSP